MNYSIKNTIITTLLFLLAAHSSYGYFKKEITDTHNLQILVDSLCNDYISKGKSAGLFVGIVQGDNMLAQGYGLIDKKGITVPDSTTIFEIGSITKTFTTGIAQVLVDKGELSWDDDIDKYNTLLYKLISYDSTTLRHLASHTSGFPGLPEIWFPKIEANMCNPYSGLSDQDLIDYMNNATDKKSPSLDSYAYSNLGMGFLGHIMEWKSGKSYEDLLQEYICEPLHMPHTSTTRVDKTKFATGYDETGKETCHWDLPIIPGAGAIKSNGADMLRYLRAHMSNTTPISETLIKTHEPIAKIPGGHIAYGWHIDEWNGKSAGIEKIIWHNGGTGGFRSYMGFIPGTDKGIVIFANQSHAEFDRLAINILLRAATVSLK